MPGLAAHTAGIALITRIAVAVTPPTSVSETVQSVVSPSAGERRASTSRPTFTMAAACRYALTGVGATMAAGNHGCSGTWADFVDAATSTSTTITA